MDCECTRFLFRGNRIQGLGRARQELYLDCLRSFKGVLRGFGKRLLWDMTPLPHTCLLAGLARTCKPQTRKGRSWTLAVADVAGKKKSISCHFISSIKQTMPIFCTALGHIRQNSPLKRGFGYVASRGADHRGGGPTYFFSPLVRSVTCWESPRTAHRTRAEV